MGPLAARGCRRRDRWRRDHWWLRAAGVGTTDGWEPLVVGPLASWGCWRLRATGVEGPLAARGRRRLNCWRPDHWWRDCWWLRAAGVGLLTTGGRWHRGCRHQGAAGVKGPLAAGLLVSQGRWRLDRWRLRATGVWTTGGSGPQAAGLLAAGPLAVLTALTRAVTAFIALVRAVTALLLPPTLSSVPVDPFFSFH